MNSFTPPLNTAASGGFYTLMALAVVTAILYFAQVVLIPVALAAMLTFLLAPFVIRIQKVGLPKPFAIVMTVIIAFSFITAIGWLVSSQVVNLAEQLPRYEQTLRDKVRQYQTSQQAPSTLSRAGDVVENLKHELENGESKPDQAGTKKSSAGAGSEAQPIKVEIESQKQSFIESFAQVAGTFVGPLGTAGLVVIFVIAMLFQREDLRDRFVHLISGGRLNLATEAIDDAAKRISRYLRMQLLVNATYGIPIGVGLYFIGVPNALLWGMLAILLRFIPYLGPWIAAVFPLALAFAVDPGWSKLFMTLGLFLTLELISNNVIEPWLYGVSTGISNFALMVAAVFWTWLWGPVGLFLSTPLTVCLVVMGDYVPSLKFISVLLGSAPALEPHARLYQRMLAMDYDEMLLLSRESLKQHSLVEFYDQLLIPALNAAEADRHAGDLAEVRQTFILQYTLELIEELEEAVAQPEQAAATALSSARILIVPANDDVDELAAEILSRVLARVRIESRIQQATSLADECSDLIARENIDVVCISAVPPAALVAARKVCRRLSTGCGDVKYVVGIWSSTAKASDLQQRLLSAAPAAVFTSMEDAVERIRTLIAVPTDETMLYAPIPENEAERLQAVERLHLQDLGQDAALDAVTRELAKVFNVPISLVSIVDKDRQLWKSQVGLPTELAEAREAPRNTSVCGHVVASNNPLVIEDIARDKRFANNPFLKTRGIRFYAGVPLRSKDGYAVGSLCVIDTKPRKVSEREIALLSLLAERLMASIQEDKPHAA